MKPEELAAAARKFPPMNDGALGDVHRCAARLTDQFIRERPFFTCYLDAAI